MAFCTKRSKKKLDLNLTVCNSQLKTVSTELMGLLLDEHLSWNNHIISLKKRFLQVFIFLK